MEYLQYRYLLMDKTKYSCGYENTEKEKYKSWVMNQANGLCMV